MISFGYPIKRLTLVHVWTSFAKIVAYEYVHAHAFLRRCFDNTVLLKQSAYRNRGLSLGRYCEVSSYNIVFKRYPSAV
mgnify:CR=1 FL=1